MLTDDDRERLERIERRKVELDDKIQEAMEAKLVHLCSLRELKAQRAALDEIARKIRERADAR